MMMAEFESMESYHICGNTGLENRQQLEWQMTTLHFFAPPNKPDSFHAIMCFYEVALRRFVAEFEIPVFRSLSLMQRDVMWQRQVALSQHVLAASDSDGEKMHHDNS